MALWNYVCPLPFLSVDTTVVCGLLAISSQGAITKVHFIFLLHSSQPRNSVILFPFEEYLRGVHVLLVSLFDRSIGRPIWNLTIFNIMGRRVARTIVPPFDGPMFILIDWNNSVRQWLSDFDLGHFKLFITELHTLKIKFNFYNFLQNFFSKLF